MDNSQNTSSSEVPPSTELGSASETIQTTGFFLPLIIYNCTVSLVALVLNFLVLVSFARTSSLSRTPSNTLLLGLAVSDFGVAAISQPLFCAWYYGVHTASMFIALRVTFDTFVATSLFVLTAITTDRFLAIHLHLRYQTVVTTKRYRFVLLGCWLCSVILCAFRFLTRFQAIYVDVIVGSIILSVNFAFFFKISQAIRRHASQIQAMQASVRQDESQNFTRYKNSVRSMYLIIAAPGLCYIPFLSTLVGHVLYNDVLSRPGFILYVAICESITMTSGAINPVIYCIRMEEIREAVIKVLRDVFVCCRSRFEQNEVSNIERRTEGESRS